MSNSNDYNNGYWSGKDSGYHQGYEEGVRAERERIKRAINGDPYANEPSTLWSMVGGSIILTILGWCCVGMLLFLFWFTGSSESWWFPWVWKVAFWGGVGFVVVMSIGGVIMTITEHREAKNPPEKPADDPNMPWYKKYPPADVIKEQEKEVVIKIFAERLYEVSG